jgi:hypothetical protein
MVMIAVKKAITHVRMSNCFVCRLLASLKALIVSWSSRVAPDPDHSDKGMFGGTATLLKCSGTSLREGRRLLSKDPSAAATTVLAPTCALRNLEPLR